MFERTGFMAKLLGILSIGIVTTLPACGGNESPPPEEQNGSGNTSAGGNASGATGGSDTGGMDTGGSGATGGSSSGVGYACANVPLPNQNITDFSVFTGDISSCDWGDSQSLTGGCFAYDGDMDDTVDILSSTLADESLNVTGDVVAYAGFGFWFGPCVDASQYSGITFTVGGNLGDNQLQFQVQTSRNYPVDDSNTKGECSGSWGSGCDNNNFTYTEDMIGEEPIAIDVMWADLTGGDPVDPLDPTELLGIQWQFNCAADAVCPLELTFDDVAFIQ